MRSVASVHPLVTCHTRLVPREWVSGGLTKKVCLQLTETNTCLSLSRAVRDFTIFSHALFHTRYSHKIGAVTFTYASSGDTSFVIATLSQSSSSSTSTSVSNTCESSSCSSSCSVDVSPSLRQNQVLLPAS